MRERDEGSQHTQDHRPETDPFVREVRRQSERARRGRGNSFWQGLGLLSGIGWMIVLPTLAGAILGRWLDVQYESRLFWTLSLLVLGLALGCVIAWRYVTRELGDDRPGSRELDE